MIIGTVSEILKHKGTQVWTIAPDKIVFEAIQVMAEKNVGALLVMDGDRLAGIISERDYTRKIAIKGKSSRDTKVQDIISSPAISANPASTVEECMRLMTDNRVRHLPVLDGSKVIGVVSIGDLVNWTITSQKATIDQLESYITGGYPS
jgi:CBS domain-containing protein